jgi:hypothetical protein
MARALLTTIYGQRACQEAFKVNTHDLSWVLNVMPWVNTKGEPRPRAEYSILGRGASQSEWSESLGHLFRADAGIWDREPVVVVSPIGQRSHDRSEALARADVLTNQGRLAGAGWTPVSVSAVTDRVK